MGTRKIIIPKGLVDDPNHSSIIEVSSRLDKTRGNLIAKRRGPRLVAQQLPDWQDSLSSRSSTLENTLVATPAGCYNPMNTTQSINNETFYSGRSEGTTRNDTTFHSALSSSQASESNFQSAIQTPCSRHVDEESAYAEDDDGDESSDDFVLGPVRKRPGVPETSDSGTYLDEGSLDTQSYCGETDDSWGRNRVRTPTPAKPERRSDPRRHPHRRIRRTDQTFPLAAGEIPPGESSRLPCSPEIAPDFRLHDGNVSYRGFQPRHSSSIRQPGPSSVCPGSAEGSRRIIDTPRPPRAINQTLGSQSRIPRPGASGFGQACGSRVNQTPGLSRSRSRIPQRIADTPRPSSCQGGGAVTPRFAVPAVPSSTRISRRGPSGNSSTRMGSPSTSQTRIPRPRPAGMIDTSRPNMNSGNSTFRCPGGASNATFVNPSANATYVPDGNRTYNNSSYDPNETREYPTDESYEINFQPYGSSTHQELPDLEDSDEELYVGFGAPVSRSQDGKYNVIQPMTPSPERNPGAACPCPGPANATFQRSANSTFQSAANATFQRPANATFQRPANATFQRPTNATFQRPANATFQRPANATFQRPANATFQRPANATFQRPANATFQRPANATFVNPAGAGNQTFAANNNQCPGGNETYGEDDFDYDNDSCFYEEESHDPAYYIENAYLSLNETREYPTDESYEANFQPCGCSTHQELPDLEDSDEELYVGFGAPVSRSQDGKYNVIQAMTPSPDRKGGACGPC